MIQNIELADPWTSLIGTYVLDFDLNLFETIVRE